jgi:hypothetical protein
MFWVMMLMVIGMCFWMVYFTKTEGFKCQSKPFQYAINTFTTSTGDSMVCSCSFPTSGDVLIIDKDNITVKSFSLFNISKLNLSG